MFDDLSNRVDQHQSDSLRDRVWRVVFLSDRRSGRIFDEILLWFISASVLVVMLESVESYRARWGDAFLTLEWIFTGLFTIEYLVRIWAVRHKRAYIFSFFGVVDFISIVPTYLTLLVAGTQYLLVVRVLRLLRVFRVLKMARHIGEANLLVNAFRQSWRKIYIFLFFVLSVILILGTLMYVVEGILAGNEGFSSVPQSIYWGIVTISTVGYGDVIPVTAAGKFISTIVMLLGYGIIAVPSGIVTAELNMSLARIRVDTRECPECGHEGHDPKAVYCKMCGHGL